MLRRRAWILAACAVLIPAAVYVIVAVQPTQQRASVILQPSRLAPESLIVSPDVPAVWFQPSSASFVALLAQTLPVRIEAAQLVHRSPSALGSVNAVPDKKTGWITVSVIAASGRSAVDTANAMATAVARNLQLRTRKAIASLQAGVQDQLAQAQDASERRVLTAQLLRFKRFRPDRQQTIQVIQPAVESQSVSNAPGVAAALSLAFALLVGAWLVRFAERADRSMHRHEDLELAAGAPLLAAIPGGERTSPEPFLRLRDAIVYLGGQGTRSTLIVTSPMGDEGRTSVAMGLANAYVAAGRSVILVDADLRNPQIASLTGMPPGVGLAEVLIGGDLEAALEARGGAGTGLTILPAGSPGPDSPDLLASARMRSVMRELSERFETVVIDTPPLLAFSDALPLIPQASGVVVVARIDHTMRGALSRAVQILKGAGANVLGPVATGARTHPRAAESVAAYAPEPEPALHAPGG